MSSVVAVTYAGTDITSNVVFSETNLAFESNAIPGTFEIKITGWAGADFVTGLELTLDVDGARLMGGFLTQASRVFAFDVVDTTGVLANIVTDQWILRGVDYNILFDKRILRNTADYFHVLPMMSGSTQDGAAITTLLANYVDDFGIAAPAANVIENIACVAGDCASDFTFGAQGQKLRDAFNNVGLRTGAVFYIAADGGVRYQALESVESAWGFSDTPDGVTAIGFREIEAVEDGSVIVNDALIWGGSQWAGPAGGTVFARTEDATSIADHNRWQMSELRFGDYLIQDDVDGRANAIVLGPPGADTLGQEKGLRYSQWDIRLIWFAHDVPSAVHLVCGDLVPIELNVFGITKLLPLRRLTVTFPDLDADGSAYVRFEGEFSLHQSDPFTIWKYILSREGQIRQTVSSSVDDTSTTTIYGAIGHFAPTPSPNGAITEFFIPFGYIPGTLEVYMDGLLQRNGLDYTESDPEGGSFTMTTPPAGVRVLWAICRTLGV